MSLRDQIESQIKFNYEFKFLFPRLENYQDLEQIKETFEPLKSINDTELELKIFNNSKFYLIKSKQYDDFHKAMKYGFWTLQDHQHLNEIYLKNKKEEKRTILFFRIHSENLLCGMAELISGFQKKEFNFWWDHSQRKGYFRLKWWYVKNLDLNSLNRKDGNVTLVDRQNVDEIQKDNGLFLLDRFKQVIYRYNMSLFHFFELFDQREDQMNQTRAFLDFEIKLEKKKPKQQIPKYKHYPSTYQDYEYEYVLKEECKDNTKAKEPQDPVKNKNQYKKQKQRRKVYKQEFEWVKQQSDN